MENNIKELEELNVYLKIDSKELNKIEEKKALLEQEQIRLEKYIKSFTKGINEIEAECQNYYKAGGFINYVNDKAWMTTIIMVIIIGVLFVINKNFSIEMIHRLLNVNAFTCIAIYATNLYVSRKQRKVVSNTNIINSLVRRELIIEEKNSAEKTMINNAIEIKTLEAEIEYKKGQILEGLININNLKIKVNEAINFVLNQTEREQLKIKQSSTFIQDIRDSQMIEESIGKTKKLTIK